MLYRMLLITLTLTQNIFTMETILTKCEQKKAGCLLPDDSFSIKNLSDDEHIDAMIHYAKQDDLLMFEYVMDNGNYQHHQNKENIAEHFGYQKHPGRSYKEIFELYKGKTVTQEKFFSAITALGRKTPNTPIRFCVKHNIDLLNTKDKEGNTPLHLAAGDYYDKWLIEITLNHPNTDINAQDWVQNTPLHKACYRSHYDVVIALLKQPLIDPTLADKGGNTPLHIAYRMWHRTHSYNSTDNSNKIIKALEQHSAILKTIKNKNNETPDNMFC